MRPFLAQKSVSSAPALKPVATGSAASFSLPVRAAPTTECPAPNVEVIKDGGQVVRIVVTCTCGQRTEIECVYPAAR